jgi:hypothetical protein
MRYEQTADSIGNICRRIRRKVGRLRRALHRERSPT